MAEDVYAVGSGARTWVEHSDYERWCLTNQHDPDSLDAVLAYEDLFDPTDDQQEPLFHSL